MPSLTIEDLREQKYAKKVNLVKDSNIYYVVLSKENNTFDFEFIE